MYLGQIWETIDGEPIYEYFVPKITSGTLLSKLSSEVWKRTVLWASNVKWNHVWIGRCTKHAVVRNNTDDTINRFKAGVSEELCSTCRGKGHPWKAKIWNGRPFIIPEGQRMPKGDHWKNPDFCSDCRGSGVKNK